MAKRNRQSERRAGFSLLELVVSLAILAMIMTPVVALLRGSQQVWEDREGDVALLEGAHATVRHVVRSVRLARRVELMTSETNPQGHLVVRLPDNRQLQWELRGNEVFYGEGAANSLLAREIDALWFVGYEDDATTKTQTVSDMRFVEVHARVQLDRSGDATREIQSKVWLRAY